MNDSDDTITLSRKEYLQLLEQIELAKKLSQEVTKYLKLWGTR